MLVFVAADDSARVDQLISGDLSQLHRIIVRQLTYADGGRSGCKSRSPLSRPRTLVALQIVYVIRGAPCSRVLGATAVSSLLRPAAAIAQVEKLSSVRSVDVHHYLYPPRYKTETYERIAKETRLAPVTLNWSPSGAIEKMDQAGVGTAINSISTPGVWFDDGDAARIRARECNDFGARLMRDYPGRFGMFAAIPLPDADGSLREIEYALDVLKLDGVGVLHQLYWKTSRRPAVLAGFR